MMTKQLCTHLHCLSPVVYVCMYLNNHYTFTACNPNIGACPAVCCCCSITVDFKIPQISQRLGQLSRTKCIFSGGGTLVDHFLHLFLLCGLRYVEFYCWFFLQNGYGPYFFAIRQKKPNFERRFLRWNTHLVTPGQEASGKPKHLGSRGSMVAKLKLKGIDGRAPPGVEPVA